MEKLDLQRRAAARSAQLLEMCPPRVSVAFAGANGARHGVSSR